MHGPGGAPAAKIDARILDEAADWLMRLHDDGAFTAADRAALGRWRAQSPAHEAAWTRAQALMGTFAGLPPQLARPALARKGRGGGRRQAVARLAALLALAPAGWLGWRMAQGQGWLAEVRTATGERRELRLPDGSELTLASASAIDLRFDAAQRLIVLRAGELLLRTAPDPGGAQRPLRVATAQGRLQALGTRFAVRDEGRRAHLAVFEGAVRVEPGGAVMPPQGWPVIQAGQQTVFSAGRTAAPPTAVDEAAALAWTRGMLLADAMPLGEWAERIGRWRTGLLHCEPAIAELRVSGAFPLADTGQALSMIVSTYPVEAVTRLRGRWVTLVPR